MSSKSSTKSQLPNKSAWARGPPQNTAAISATSTPTRSQSPAPQQTHSRRPSTLGQGVSVKDGVALPRTVKTTATPVTFGSINDASAPISSSPSPAVSPPTAASVKSDVVKSFGSVPAQQPNGSINASTTAAPSASSAGAAASSSSANPTPPPASSAPKLDKKDILKMFQNPPSASSSSTPPPSNDSGNRSSPAPAVSSQPSTSSTSTTSGSSNQPPSFPPFVPSGSRPPQSSSSSQPPRSPVYSRQMPNGSGPRPPQGGPANAAAGGPASPRLAPPNMQGPGAPPGAPPQGAPQMHPGMPPQPMPGWGYYPGMDPNQPYYVPYGWYVPPMPMPGHPGAPAPPGAHHPPHHPHQPHPNQHPGPPGTPHGPPHALPLSPRPPPPNALPPGTPTTPHAALHTLPHHPGGPHHGPHHGPHGHHSNQGSISVTSPPGTPASASASITSPNSASSKLNASSSAFVPGGAGNRASKIVFKNADGSEVDFTAIAKQSRGDASPGPKSATFPRQPSPAPASQNGSAAGTPKRKSIRLESEEQRKARLDLEAKEKEAKEAEVRKQKEREEQERKDREAKEQKEREREERKKKEEEERKEKERRKKEEEEREEQARKKKIEEERERKKREAEEERERKKVEEAERAKREEEDKIRKQKEKEERKKRDEERKKQEEEDRKKREAEEEIARQEREAAEAKRKVEEAERAKVEAEKKAAEEAAAKAKAEEDAAIKLTEEPEEGEIKETESPIAETAPNSASRDPKSGLRINTGLDGPRRGPRPDPLDLTGAKGPFTGPGALPSALATARNIESLESVQYPEGILSPKPELNKNVKDGFGFRYDRDFLLQFMKLCTEKPASLPPLHVLGLEPSGDQPSHHMTRTSSGRHGRSASGAISARQASIGLGIQGGGKFPPSGAQPFGTMGNFAGSGSKLSSEDRFAQSQRAASMSGGAFSAGRPTGMTRTASQGGRDRTRSKRGEKRGEGNKAPSNLGPGGSSAPTFAEPVAPLVASSNAWSARARAGATQDADSPEIVDRKVKSLLNKLTMEKFDSISDQIIQWANKSEKEKDGRTLIQVIRLVFEKATDEATWSEMYARLCRKMMERISPLVQDDGIRNPEGKPITGGQLFRKYLLNRCQEDFERGWVNKEATAAAAATKALEDEALKQAHDKQDTDEPVLYSDEYYAAQKAKRQGLGLIKFIGELFKLQMLTERIMHECVKKLLGNVDNPEEEEIESLCKLLTTVGQSLDTPKARAHMDVYFSRMKELTKSPNVSSRMQFMLQDVLELRERKWVSRQAVAAPSTIAQVHENAAKEKAVAEKEAYSRQISMSRGGSRRGGDRGDFAAVGPDGWAVAGAGPPRAPSKAGDLSKFGQINKSTPMTFGPTSVFAGKNKEGKRDSISRTNSSQNMFSMLQASEAGEAAPSKAPEPQRKRLVLQPRTVPTEGDAAVPKSPSESSVSEEGEAEEDAGGMSEEAAEAKVKEDIKEFFAIRSIDEAEVYWTALPPAHHHRLVDKLLSQAVEAKEQDAQLVADLFKAIVSKELCSADAFEQGFVNIANFIEDIAIDAPKAVTYFGMIVKAVDLDDEHRRRLADKASEGHEDEGKEEYAERILKAIS